MSVRAILYGFLLLLFLAFAAVQFNDPDPLLWIATYLFSAWLCWAAWQRQGSSRTYVLVGIVFALWAVNQFPPIWEGVGENELGMKTLNIELARESLGLGICAIANLIHASWLRR